jgi:hypothetical protein
MERLPSFNALSLDEFKMILSHVMTSDELDEESILNRLNCGPTHKRITPESLKRLIFNIKSMPPQNLYEYLSEADGNSRKRSEQAIKTDSNCSRKRVRL